MSRFSPSDTALEGFRLTREQPLSVLVWAGAQFAFFVASLAIQFELGGAAFQQLLALELGTEKPTPQLVAQLSQQLTPVSLLVFLMSLAFYAIMYAALLRAILRPADKAFFYLRLSMDEVRQFALSLIIALLLTAYAFVLSAVSGVLIDQAQKMGQASLPVQILVILALIAAFAYPLVRLSLAPAMTFVEGRVVLFRSLEVSKGQFWAIAGSYVLALVLTIVVLLLAAVAFTFVEGALTIVQKGVSALPTAMAPVQPAELTLRGFLSPARMPTLVFGAVLCTLAYLIIAGPAPAIFRALAGRVGAASATVAEPGKPWG